MTDFTDDLILPVGDSFSDDDEVAYAAGRWKALLESGVLSEEDQREFDTWLEGDMRHSWSMCAIERRVESLRTLRPDPTPAYRRIPTADPGSGEYELALTPPTRALVLSGGPQQIQAEAGESIAYTVADGSTLRIAPLTQADTDSDDVVRNITLRSGSMLVTRPPDAPGVLLVQPSTGGCVRVATSSTVLIEVIANIARVSAAAGSCVVTITDVDFQVVAGECAVFDDAMGRLFGIDPVDAFAVVEDRLIANGRALRDVVDTLASYSRIPIKFSPALANKAIRGQYRLSTTSATLAGIADEISAKFEDRGSELSLSVA